jgi:hypothetical protein
MVRLVGRVAQPAWNPKQQAGVITAVTREMRTRQVTGRLKNVLGSLGVIGVWEVKSKTVR